MAGAKWMIAVGAVGSLFSGGFLLGSYHQRRFDCESSAVCAQGKPIFLFGSCVCESDTLTSICYTTPDGSKPKLPIRTLEEP